MTKVLQAFEPKPVSVSSSGQSQVAVVRKLLREEKMVKLNRLWSRRNDLKAILSAIRHIQMEAEVQTS